MVKEHPLEWQIPGKSFPDLKDKGVIIKVIEKSKYTGKTVYMVSWYDPKIKTNWEKLPTEIEIFGYVYKKV